ncbi:retrovirus-related pol polyprotein from transposon TNT 1-94 [Tanacetum coccineum]|uniref:Retrovirus-related pol polyprotein from transposon TNT 1-94 n=1 Tax=Tanacetum coccineum TaxID=301880 RepID=A0ABQ5IPI7_9ASTR
MSSKKKGVNSNLNGLSSTGVDNTTKTRRPQPRSNIKNDRVPSESKSSCIKNKEVEVEVEEHPRNLLLSKNKKHMSSECNNVKLATRNDKSEVVCAMCKQCLITANHDKFLGTVRFGNDLVVAILDLEVAFRRNTCFIRNLEGVDLLKGNHKTNLYTINLHEMVSTSPICLMASATSTKSWLWHPRLSHLNFDTINDLAKNDLVTGLPKFKYHKEHLCPSYEQRKSKRAPHPPKLVPNSKQRSKDEAPEVIKTFLKRITVLLQSPNDREDIRKLAVKGDIGFFIGYSADSCAYRVYNRRTKKIIETMNVTFDELSAMAFL